ncbi:unnamed protein product [Malus baccata var. baccata]
MSGPSDRHFDLNLGEEADAPSPDNIWRLSFLSPTGPLTVGESVIKNDMTAAMVARNIFTSKDNRLLSKRSDELAIKDSLALSVKCAGSVLNIAQRLFARTRQIESLAAKARNDYATNMKRKLDQVKESNGQILLDHQRVLSSTEAPSDHPLVPSLSGALPIAETSPKQPL